MGLFKKPNNDSGFWAWTLWQFNPSTVWESYSYINSEQILQDVLVVFFVLPFILVYRLVAYPFVAIYRAFWPTRMIRRYKADVERRGV